MGNVEILMATYNGAKYLPAQLDSILAQDTDCWHLTVSDDGSTDGTPEILDDYVRRFPEKITRVYSDHRFGNARDHFFWLMKQCKADYIHFSDQDDVWHPDKVRRMQQALEQAEKDFGKGTPLQVFTDQTVVDERLNEIAPSLMAMQKQNPALLDYRNILFQNVVTGCAMAINRNLAMLAGKCENPESVIMHDWWLALVAAKFGKTVYLNISTMEYRQHGGNSVGAKSVTGFSYFVRKVSNLDELRREFSLKKKQAETFLQCYQSKISQQDAAFFNEFCKKKGSLCFKCRFQKYVFGLLRKAGFLLLW